jgi:hypothetical protein
VCGSLWRSHISPSFGRAHKIPLTVPVLVEYWPVGGVADLGLKNLQLDFRQQFKYWCCFPNVGVVGRERVQLAMILCVVCVLCAYDVRFLFVESLSVLYINR